MYKWFTIVVTRKSLTTSLQTIYNGLFFILYTLKYQKHQHYIALKKGNVYSSLTHKRNYFIELENMWLVHSHKNMYTVLNFGEFLVNTKTMQTWFISEMLHKNTKTLQMPTN